VKLGIILATQEDLRHAHALALAARRARHEVSIFAMDAGCAALAAEPGLARELVDADCGITACSNSAVDLELVEGIARGSQDDHAAVIATADRLVALT
jgi:hypothetical protein